TAYEIRNVTGVQTCALPILRNIASLEVDMVNIHALGGREMIAAAKEGLMQGAGTHSTPSLVAVTILTSVTDDILGDELGLNGNVKRQAVRLASLAQEGGADGVVCSAYEAADIKMTCRKPVIAVTPVSRLASTSHHDQKRVMTLSDARENKADILVMGRSITTSDEPLRAYDYAKKEWERATY